MDETSEEPPLTPDLPYRTNAQTVAATVHPGRHAVCVDAVGMAVMGYDPYAERGTPPFI